MNVTAVSFLPQRFLQQLRDIASRMSHGSRGAGLGVKLLLGAGALAYGIKEATYTGTATAGCGVCAGEACQIYDFVKMLLMVFRHN